MRFLVGLACVTALCLALRAMLGAPQAELESLTNPSPAAAGEHPAPAALLTQEELQPAPSVARAQRAGPASLPAPVDPLSYSAPASWRRARVVDAHTGAALAGVEVRWFDTQWMVEPGMRAGARAALRATERFAWRAPYEGAETSDAAGWVRFPRLDRRVHLRIPDAAGHGRDVDPTTPEPILLRMQSGRALLVQVVDPRGRAQAGVRVRAGSVHGKGHTASCTTDADGVARLDRAEVRGVLPRSAQGFQVEALLTGSRAGQVFPLTMLEVEQLVLRIPAIGSLTLRLSGAEPATGTATVRLGEDEREAHARVRGGVAHFDAVPVNGSLSVAASAPGYWIESLEELGGPRPAGEELVVELACQRLPRVHLRLVDAAGAPLPATRVIVETGAGSALRGRAGADARVELVPLRSDPPSGWSTLIVRIPGRETAGAPHLAVLHGVRAGSPGDEHPGDAHPGDRDLGDVQVTAASLLGAGELCDPDGLGLSGRVLEVLDRSGNVCGRTTTRLHGGFRVHGIERAGRPYVARVLGPGGDGEHVQHAFELGAEAQALVQSR